MWYNQYMEQTLTAKLKILPTPSEAELLMDTMRTYSEACNYVSDYVFSTHDLNLRSLNRELYHAIRQKYSLPSQMAQSVLRTVVGRYKAILTSEKQWIRPQFRTPQLDLVWNRDYSLVSGRTLFSVNTLKGRIKVGFCSYGVNLDGRFGTARLVYRHGKFFLHIPITNDIDEVSLSDICHITGIDRGIRFLAASYDSDGNCSFYSGRKIKEKRAHFKMLRKELQQVKTPSSRRRLKAIGNRENRYVRDVNHVISKALVSQNPDNTLFVLEDLKGIRSAAERVRVEDRYVTVSWPYYDLEQKLIYKAERNHQKVIKVDPKYTSQRCPVCGHTAKANRDKRNHIFRCGQCGYTSNDDRIGAMNLCSMGIQYLAQSQGSISSLTGSQPTGPDVTAAAGAVTNMGGIMPTTMGQSQAPASRS